MNLNKFLVDRYNTWKMYNKEIDMSLYESEPCTSITRKDGSVLRFHRRKSDPNASICTIDGEVLNFNSIMADALK